MRNTRWDDKRRALPMLPPGAVLQLTAKPAPESRRLNPHDRVRLPRSAEMRSQLQNGLHAGPGGVRRLDYGPTIRLGGIRWSICGVLHEPSVILRHRPAMNASRQPSAACRLTAFLFADWHTIADRLSSGDLERFRQFALSEPFNADVRRNLRMYLLLRLLQEQGGLPAPAAGMVRYLAGMEQRRMFGRLQSALRRLGVQIRDATRNRQCDADPVRRAGRRSRGSR